MKESKAVFMLEKVRDYIGGDLRISYRGVPHLVINDFYSICYFARSKSFKAWTGYGTDGNTKLKNFKVWPELVRYFHFKLKIPYIGKYSLEMK